METEQARPSDEVGITVHIHKAFWRRSQNVVTDQIRETSGALLGDAVLDGAGGWGPLWEEGATWVTAKN